MLARRSVLAFLGLAPVAAPAAIAAMTAPAPEILGVDVTVDSVTAVRAGLVTPALVRAKVVRAYGQLWESSLREQEAFLARLDACGLVLPCEPVGDA